LARVRSLQSEANRKVTFSRFAALREAIRKAGRKRVFVVGNGASLQRTDLSLLQDEITIDCGSSFAASFLPTVCLLEEPATAEERLAEFHGLRCAAKIVPAYLGYCIDAQPNTIFLNHLPSTSFPADIDFSAEAGRVSYAGGSSAFLGIQVAASLGFDEIYLVGVDAGDGETHGTLRAHRKALLHARRAGIRIANATLGGELEVFPRVDFYGLFGSQAFPRVAIIDFTHINQLCATGVIKQNLFGGWPITARLNVHAEHPSKVSVYQKVPADRTPPDSDSRNFWGAVRALLEFDPEVLYLRPTHDRPMLSLLQA